MIGYIFKFNTKPNFIRGFFDVEVFLNEKRVKLPGLVTKIYFAISIQGRERFIRISPYF